jgi:hypothetical protein
MDDSNFFFFLVFGLIWWLAAAVVLGNVAGMRQLSKGKWFFCGLVFGPLIGGIFLLAIPAARPYGSNDEPMRRGPGTLGL